MDRLLAASELAAESVDPDRAVERAERDVQGRVELVQVPAQPLLTTASLVDEVVAVVDEQLQQEPGCPMCELGWKSLGVLEPTALPSIDEERWVPLVQETDVLLETLGVVDFSIFPHDQTAIKVTDGTVDVVSEGHWKLLTP